MTGISEKITTPGSYKDLVDGSLVREALNYENSTPSKLALDYRMEEAAQRIEDLTRLTLPTSDWEHEFEAPYFREQHSRPNLIRIPGLFAVGVDPTVSVTDGDGAAITVTATVQGPGDEVWLQPSDLWFTDRPLPISISITRGVSSAGSPGRSASGPSSRRSSN